MKNPFVRLFCSSVLDAIPSWLNAIRLRTRHGAPDSFAIAAFASTPAKVTRNPK